MAAAKGWLRPSGKLTTGFQRLLDHDRLDLSVEAVVLEEPWSQLFTKEELDTARARLEQFGYFERKPDKSTDQDYAFPEELSEPEAFPEGARSEVIVNSYERDPQARAACIQHYGAACYVCGFDFEAKYGELGGGFIQVHHLTPFSTASAKRETDPITDLRPVCPNCHAMLHKRNPPIPVADLKKIVRTEA